MSDKPCFTFQGFEPVSVANAVARNVRRRSARRRSVTSTSAPSIAFGPNGRCDILGAYLGAYLSQVNRVRRLNKRLRVYKIGPDLVLNDKNRKNLQRKTFWQSISEKTLKENNNCFRVPEKKRWRRDDNFIGTKKFAKNVFFMRTSNNFINHVKFELEWNTFFIWSRKTIR